MVTPGAAQAAASTCCRSCQERALPPTGHAALGRHRDVQRLLSGSMKSKLDLLLDLGRPDLRLDHDLVEDGNDSLEPATSVLGGVTLEVPVDIAGQVIQHFFFCSFCSGDADRRPQTAFHNARSAISITDSYPRDKERNRRISASLRNMSHPSKPNNSPEMEYERLSPGGAAPGQRQDRAKRNPHVIRHDDDASPPGNSNDDHSKPKPKKSGHPLPI